MQGAPVAEQISRTLPAQPCLVLEELPPAQPPRSWEPISSCEGVAFLGVDFLAVGVAFVVVMEVHS